MSLRSSRVSAWFVLAAACFACSGDSEEPAMPAEPESPPAESAPDCGAGCGDDPVPTGGQSFDDGDDDPPPPLSCRDNQRLVGRRCEPLAEPGEACTESNDCRTGICRLDGSNCINENCSDYSYDGVCGEPGQLGEGCVPYDQCDAALACSPRSRSCVTLGAEGAPCQWSTDCNDMLVCRSYASGNACGPSSALGEACNAYADCEPGLVCYRMSQLCDDPGRAESGELCLDDGECASDLVCNTVGLRQNILPSCTPPIPIGGECERVEECEAGGLCIVGSCSALGGAGDFCETDEHCTVGLRCNYGDPMAGGDAYGVCREPAAVGLPCWRDEDCIAGLDCEYPENPGPAEGGTCAAS